MAILSLDTSSRHLSSLSQLFLVILLIIGHIYRLNLNISFLRVWGLFQLNPFRLNTAASAGSKEFLDLH